MDHNFERFLNRASVRIAMVSSKADSGANRHAPINRGPRGRIQPIGYASRCGGWKPIDQHGGTVNLGLNKLCRCGSGKKYKRCCITEDLARAEANRRIRHCLPMLPVPTGKTLGDGNIGRGVSAENVLIFDEGTRLDDTLPGC